MSRSYSDNMSISVVFSCGSLFIVYHYRLSHLPSHLCWFALPAICLNCPVRTVSFFTSPSLWTLTIKGNICALQAIDSHAQREPCIASYIWIDLNWRIVTCLLCGGSGLGARGVVRGGWELHTPSAAHLNALSLQLHLIIISIFIDCWNQKMNTIIVNVLKLL